MSLFSAASARLFSGWGKSKIGGAGIARRLGVGAAWWGGGELAQSYIEHNEEEKRAYYGDSRYESYYGKGASGLSFGVGFYTKGHAFGALLGRDPINRAINSITHRSSTVASTARKRYLNLKSRRDTYGPEDQAQITHILHRRKAQIDRAINVPKLGFRSAGFYGGLAATALGAPTGMAVEGFMGGAVIDTLIGFSKSSRARAAYRGQAIASGEVMIDKPTFRSRSGSGYGYMRSLAVAGIGAGAGYYLGAVNTNRSAEGPITSFEKYNEQGVSRMNFSTAGLGLAIHRNQRRY